MKFSFPKFYRVLIFSNLHLSVCVFDCVHVYFCVCVCFLCVCVFVCICVSSITYLLLRFDVFGLCVCERVPGVRFEYKGSELILSTAIQYLALSPTPVPHTYLSTTSVPHPASVLPQYYLTQAPSVI